LGKDNEAAAQALREIKGIELAPGFIVRRKARHFCFPLYIAVISIRIRGAVLTWQAWHRDGDILTSQRKVTPMKNWVVIIAAALAMSASSASAQVQVKCEANVNGYRIKTVYITGSQYNSVVWAYKHIGEATCLTPVTDAAKADAILEVVPFVVDTPASATDGGSLSVSCSSHGSSSSCLDSDGNELDVDCDRNGNCSSYYGPSAGVALLHAAGEWIRNGWEQAEARLYTPDHKLIWKSENQKSHFPDLWPDKLRNGTNSPSCPRPTWTTHYYKNFRQLASERCKVEFDPLVSIDIKANARTAQKQAAIDQKQSEADEMKRNAQEAAAKQQPQGSQP
jgi:hypothetical protein